jgi:hypothetical protein
MLRLGYYMAGPAMLTPAPLPKQDPADAPYHFCALASLCDDGPRAPEEG